MAHPYAWFGKLPALGDFTESGLTPELRQCWDQYLSGWMLNGQRWHGDHWIDTYLSMPVFSFQSGSCCELSMKEQHCAGILMPSVDKSGRYFPFVLMCAAAPQHTANTPKIELDQWLFRLRQICSAALYEDWSVVQLNTHLEQLQTPAVLASEGISPKQCLWQTIDQHGKLGEAHTCDGFPDWAYFKDATALVCP